MASDLVVPVVQIENVRIHANSDNLELCNVLGYQMCIRKGEYKDGQLVVYYPADVLLTPELADRLGVRKFLKGKEQTRVGRIRLRGEPSFGLISPLPEGTWKLGDNLAEHLHCQKYEPPIRATAGDAAPRDPLIDPFFEQFTDVQNGRIFTDIFVDGEEVIYTEKIHGTSGRLGTINGQYVAGSMSVRRKSPTRDEQGIEVPCQFDSPQMQQNTYWYPWSIPAVRKLIQTLELSEKVSDSIKPVILLYGEVYGGSIQSLDYGIPKGRGLGFRAFGLRVNGKFLDWNDFAATCQKYGVETVPVLGRGQFSLSAAQAFSAGKSTMADHIKEGTVVYPVKEREHPKIGRVILKYIGTEYELSKHKEQDTTDA